MNNPLMPLLATSTMEVPMDAESFVEAIKERDARIAALTEYAQALEAALAEKRGSEAQDAAYRETWDTEIRDLRYRHGLRSNLRPH